jgi:glycosidase
MFRTRIAAATTGFLLVAACGEGAVTGAAPAVADQMEAVAESGEPTDRFAPRPLVAVDHAEWTRDAVLYQINTRQFTEEGTFAAAQEHLPRLAELGVDILWLMPIHPIGEEKRKGSLGSPYSVADYYGVNPEFGTHDDLKAFIDAAHELGMYVILDWVANHSAWDNALVREQPDWYTRDWRGEMHSTPWTDWSDIVDFDYSQPGMRQYMTEAMSYWVREVGVDGFRCDVAGMVPLDFWETLREELDQIKPVFMLAEWESRDVGARAFDATYAWSWKDAMQSAARGGGPGALRGFYYNHHNSWPVDTYRMVYTSNHDQNAWDGPAPEIYGEAYEAAIAMSFVGEGMPLIYNGQEAGLDRRLEFFEKDEIEWRDDPLADLFADLIALKTETRALWNGGYGAPLVPVATSDDERVFAFARYSDTDGVFAVFNLSDDATTVTFPENYHHGDYAAFRTGEPVAFESASALELEPWGYRIYRR